MKSINTNFLALYAIVLACSCSKTEITNSLQSSSSENSSATILKTSLVAWYTFDGDILDHSSYGNNVSFSSATPVTGKDGTPNSAYYFDGSSGYMVVPNSASLNGQHGITLAATINVAGFYRGQYHSNRILQKGFQDQSDGVYFLGFDDYLSGDNTGSVVDSMESFYGTYGNNQFNSIGVRDTSSADFIRKNRWYTIVYTVDTNRVGRLYVNGELKGTDYNANSDFSPNNDDLIIGKTLNPQFPYWFHGIIDEIRIYNRAYDANAVGEILKDMKK
jgi:hypothetical protein